MKLPRAHLFELEDLPWFPVVVRNLATDYLQFVQSRLALHEPIVSLLREAVVTTDSKDVIDLCSGGGGPVLALQRALAAGGSNAVSRAPDHRERSSGSPVRGRGHSVRSHQLSNRDERFTRQVAVVIT